MKFKNSSMHNDLLIAADKILIEDGIDHINIRHLAEKTGIPTGTIYNYFSSKDEILVALTAEYWSQALEEIKWAQFNTFVELVAHTHQVLSESMKKHGSLINKQLSARQSRGVNQIKLMSQQLFDVMLHALNKDTKVTTHWTDEFSKEKFVDFVVSQILVSLRREQYDMKFCFQVLSYILYNNAK